MFSCNYDEKTRSNAQIYHKGDGGRVAVPTSPHRRPWQQTGDDLLWFYFALEKNVFQFVSIFLDR